MYRMQILNQEDCKCRALGVCAKKHSSLWWSLPRLDRDLIQWKQWLELTKCAGGTGCLSLHWALTELLLWLRSLVMTFIIVTGASCKDRKLPIAVCRVAQISACYIALNMPCPRCMCPRGTGFKIYCTNCVFILNKSRVVRSKLTLTTSQSPQKIMRLLEIWEISQVLRWWSQMMTNRCNFWMGERTHPGAMAMQ